MDVICDLDGVVYRGTEPIPGSALALKRLASEEFRTIFVTNNSTRTPEQVAEKLIDVVGYEAALEDIVTSAQSAAAQVPGTGTPIMVVGGDGIRRAVEAEGHHLALNLEEVACVVVGMDFGFDYQTLKEASKVLRDGAVFIASNRDATYPTPEGLLPGAGSMVAALATASGVEPINAGKPCRPIRDLIRSRGVGSAWVIGDRIDTDIQMAAHESDWSPILVLTGVTTSKAKLDSVSTVEADLAAAVDLVIRTRDRQ